MIINCSLTEIPFHSNKMKKDKKFQSRQDADFNPSKKPNKPKKKLKLGPKKQYISKYSIPDYYEEE